MIYAVIIEGDNRAVKIGKTLGDVTDVRAVRRRLGSLQTGVPNRLMCIALMAGYTDEEKELHARFNDYRLRREWFERTPDVNAWIAEYAIGSPIVCDHRPNGPDGRSMRPSRPRREGYGLGRPGVVELRRGPFDVAAGKQLIRYKRP